MSLNGSSRRVLLIYQMPKTGSQTVQATLAQCQLPHQVYRFHFLSKEIAGTMKKAIRAKEAAEAWKDLVRAQLVMMKEVRRIIRARKWQSLWRRSGRKLEVITSLREPIGLGLSSVFENHSFLFTDLGRANVETCRTELMRPRALKYVREWFDWELRPMLGIDVYAQPFPFEKGYAIYENRYARLLVYRYETMASLPAVLGDFLDCKVPEVISCNISRSKAYGGTYEAVKAQLRFPAEFVMEQCNSKIMKHFYSETERQALVKKWTETSAANRVAIAA